MTTPTPTRKTVASERIVWGPWWRAAFIIVGLLGIVAIAFAFWLNSDADLRAVERRAKAEGIPLTWKELGRTQSPPEILERWKELMELAKRCPPWQNKREKGEPNWTPSWIGETLPASFIHYHAGLDPEALARIDTLFGELGDAPVLVIAEPTIDGTLPDISPMRDLTSLLSERMVLAPADDVGPACLRMLSLADRGDPTLLINDLILISIRTNTLTAMVNRQETIRASPQREEILAWLDRKSEDLTESFRLTLNGEICAQLQSMKDVSKQDTLPDIGERIPTFLHRPLLRLGRRRILDEELDILIFLHGKPSVAAIITESARCGKKSGPRWDPRVWLRNMLIPVFEELMKKHVRESINCRLIASYLRGDSLPIDLCDPAGGAMRPIMRDDVMIGAYSIGFDQVDNGGDKFKDFCFSLTARLGSPRAADPPPVPKP